MLSPVRLSSVCLSSVTFVRPRQAVEIFGNFLHHLVHWPPADVHEKFYGDRPIGTPPSEEGVKRKSGSQIQRFWTYQKLYLGKGAR